jgi:hypothetical protein
MRGSMLILTWVGIIYLSSFARCKIMTNIMPTHVKIRIEPGIRELFLKQNISVTTLSEHTQNRQRLFLGTVPITSRYYLQEYITLQKLFQLPPAIIYKNL